MYSVAAAEEADLPDLVNKELTPPPATLSKLLLLRELVPAEAEFLLDTVLTLLDVGGIKFFQLGRT